MVGENFTSTKTASVDDAQSRQRSSISFPYVDIGAAFNLALAIHSHVGHGSCTEDQLAAWTNQSARSSGFREQIRAAKMAALIEGESGNLQLAEVGRNLADPDKARAAKAQAFLSVPLFKAVYDKYRGTVLPPAAALERDMVGLGVSEKQKDRARQVLERSADLSGFFESGKTKLVMPAIAEGSGTRGQRENKSSGNGGEGKGDSGGNGSASGGGASGGGEGGASDPLIQAVIQKLPAKGPWPADDRIKWLKMLSMAFDIAYGSDEEIQIRNEAAH